MDAIGGFWKWNPLLGKSKPSRRRRIESNSGSIVEASYRFPLKQAVTAASLALTGDTIAQLRDRWSKAKEASKHQSASDADTATQDILWRQISEHDWLRALRMTSYGFLLYGPGSYSWYQCLDHFLPKPTVQNVMLKVLLNQIVLGPCVIAVIFAWNNLWLKKLPELPGKYKRDALPTLLYGFRFWIPVSVINFWFELFGPRILLSLLFPRNLYRVVPLQARVAFMSMGSIFWNFYLSSSMSK